MTAEQALKELGAITDPVFPDLNRLMIYIIGEAKTGKSTIASSFPGGLHVDFLGEAHAIPARRGHYVFCPVWSKADLIALKKTSPLLWGRKDGMPDPTCWESITEKLTQLASLPNNPITSVVIDSGEQFQQYAKDFLERGWGLKKVPPQERVPVEDHRGGLGGHGSVNDLCRNELMKLSRLGYGRVMITHLRSETEERKEGNRTVRTTVYRSGVTPTLDKAFRDDSHFIWMAEKSPNSSFKDGKLVPNINIRTAITASQKEGLATGNRVPLPDSFDKIPITDVYSVINEAYMRGVEQQKAVHAAAKSKGSVGA